MNEREIFMNAPTEVSPEELEAYLDQVCGDDASLRNRVNELMRADADAGIEFMRERNTWDFEKERGICSNERTSTAESPVEIIENYELLRQIGEGGFGVVYLAEQTQPLRRRVAVKIIKEGMDTREFIARFEIERQALAMMEHPNIAKVFDAGATESGRPFFAMEFVEGIPITRFCRDQKYGPRRKLELFRAVCSAINHAHQKGIIHRDLKPSNVMVTLSEESKPLVKVIDFGIAKSTDDSLTDQTLVTRIGRFFGTPAYLSPEQAAMSSANIDTRSDIYSLGVLLYELLTEVPPFDPKILLSAGYDEMRRIIAEVNPPKPSTRLFQTLAESGENRRVKSATMRGLPEKDLDWVVMKALEKDRSRRYETAHAFSTDIERYLNDQPVLAAAPSVSYKLRKFARRNKAAFATATALTFLLLAGIATTTWQAILAGREADRANEAEKIAERSRSKSDQARRDAEDATAFVIEIIQTADPWGQGGKQKTVAQALKNAVLKLDSNLIEQPKWRSKLQHVIGTVYSRLGHRQEAVALLEKSYNYQKQLFSHEDERLIPILKDLAEAYYFAEMPAKEVVIREAHLALCQKTDGRKSNSALWAMYGLFQACQQVGRDEDARILGEQYLLLLEEQVPNLSRELGRNHPKTLNARTWLARRYFSLGQKKMALRLREEIYHDCRDRTLSKTDRTIATVRWYLADSYQDAGRLDDAIALVEKDLEECRAILGDDDSASLSRMKKLARLYTEAGRKDEAIRLHEKGLELRSGKVHHDPGLSQVRNDLLQLYSQVGRIREAIALQEQILSERRKRFGETNDTVIDAMKFLAKLHREIGQSNKAEKLEEETKQQEQKAREE